MDSEEPDSETKEVPESRRACDQCRLRKIRCDKRSPCANCRSSKIVCRSTGAGQKPPEPRRRVLISSQYEHKIDLIEERLSSIEDVLRDLKAVSKQAPSKIQSTSALSTALERHESPSFEDSFEGNSSMAAHSAYASKLLETAVSRSGEMSSPKIGAALSTLRQIVNMHQNQKSQASSKARLPRQIAIHAARSGAKLKDLPMPPVDVALSVCKWATETFPAVLQGYCPFITVERFVQKCREVYFAVEDYSDATFIVVNGCLYNILLERVFVSNDPAEREECQRYINLCQNNLETALVNMSLLMPARDEYIEALALGAIHAIEISKPSFAWALTSTATRLCQTLGYHRASSMENDPPHTREVKSVLFWTIYSLDKAVSLRLGRSSSIQDYDITLSPDISLGTCVSQLWENVYRLWVRVARIQGKVYEFLFSPAALAQPESDREAYARQLASEMQTTVMDPFELITPNPPSLTIEDLYIRSDRVGRLSILTLIYRAIPSPPGSSSTFIPECIETARTALEAHQECMNMLTKCSEELKCSYMHWSILYSPFIPFIVLICNLLEAPTTASTSTTAGSNNDTTKDLTHLTTFLNSIRPLTPFSTAIANLHRLCNVLYSIARLYVEAKTANSGAHSHNSHSGPHDQGQTQGQGHNQDQGSHPQGQGIDLGQIPETFGVEFDACFSALGLAQFVPASSDSGHGQGQGLADGGHGLEHGNGNGHVGNADQTTLLENWFSGNQYMTGLLEEDLSLIDFST